jgi:hypothetical protein
VGNFLPQKPLKIERDVFLHLYCSESWFWIKAAKAFEFFGWFLVFQKQKQVRKSNQIQSKPDNRALRANSISVR